MLDFDELSKDGIEFEQLIRELLLKEKLRPFWTGKGPDGGRDLIAEEILTGSISDHKRTWLVDCKDFSKSGKSVGASDVQDIRDRCERISADAFLLATSTQPTSELVRKLKELNDTGFLCSIIWDGVEIERKLLTPISYSIAQQFFPKSMSTTPWKLFYTEREERWQAHYKGYFLYVESRAGISPPSLFDLERIIGALETVELGENEELRVRSIWHDTPNGPFYFCCADYLVPSTQQPSLSPDELKSQLDDWCVDGGDVTWSIKLQITLTASDYYSPDDPAFYASYKRPLYDALYKKADIRTVDSSFGWDPATPPIRTFNDQAMWQRDKEMHGFVKMGNLETYTKTIKP